MTSEEERTAVVAYLRKVAGRFQGYGFPERYGRDKADEMTEFCDGLAGDIEAEAHLDDDD